MTADLILVQLVNGLAYGLLLFMLAAGLTLIYSIMGVLNFAHAGFYMLGAYLGYQCALWFNFWLALALAPTGTALLGAAVQRWGLRQAARHGHLAEMLFTFGVLFVITEGVQLIWGRAPLHIEPPDSLQQVLVVLGVPIAGLRAFVMLIAAMMLAAMALLLGATRVGLIVRAAITHPQQLEAMGYNVPRVMTGVFAGGCALAGLGGVLGGALFVTEPAMAANIGALVFVIVVIGGLGSLSGAFLAALLVGLLETFAKASRVVLFDGALSLAQLAPLLPYLALVLILLLRPRGLLGQRES